MCDSDRIECPDWAPIQGKTSDIRCNFFLEGGTCLHEGHFVCTESRLLSADNLLGRTPALPGPPAPPETPPTTGTSGDAGEARKRASRAQEPGTIDGTCVDPSDFDPMFELIAPAPAPPKTPPKPKLRLVTKKQIVDEPIVIAEAASFSALSDVDEVKIDDQVLGEVTLVHKFTGQERTELTFEAAHVISRIKDAFPMAQLVSITLKKHP